MTRRIASLVLLIVLIFNMGGYFMLYPLLELRASEILDKRIKAGDMGAEELVEFKVTFELPYPVHDQQLVSNKRVDGSDVSYTITTHEYKDYALTLVGVRDQWAYHVGSVMEAFNKAVNGDTNALDGILHCLSGFLTGFDRNEVIGMVTAGRWVRMLCFGSATADELSPNIPVDPKPPRA